jgi:hypothetical protein
MIDLVISNEPDSELSSMLNQSFTQGFESKSLDD